jgi:hypothetical protein
VSTDQVLALVVIVALVAAFSGYWLAQIETKKETEMSYRKLHRHVHHRLGLKPPAGPADG